MIKLTKSYNLLGLAILVLAVFIWMWPGKKEAFSFSEKMPVSVRCTEVTKATTSRVVTYSGVTRSEKRASLGFILSGRIIARPVEVGEAVKKDQVIARIDDREFRNNLNMAEASVNELSLRVDQAERHMKRISELFNTGAASPQEHENVETSLETLKASLKSAKAQLSEARRVLEESTIRAPFSGTVTRVMAEPGEWTGPGSPVVILAGDGTVELKVEVPENTVTRLSQDQLVQVSLPCEDGRQVKGWIKSLARSASGPGKLFPVVIALDPDTRIFSGMTAELMINIRMEDSIGVPVKSILNPGASNPYIFCLKNGFVKKIPVELGALKGDRVVVKGDVINGDMVLVSGHTMLADGDRVEVAQ